MKVTEVACILGAWATLHANTKRVLDIGCGTGLLSLMLAQRYPSVAIDAIEIDEDCSKQARENIAESAFRERVHIIRGDVLQYHAPEPYGYIIANPPFFENDLRSSNKQKNIAWHNESLTLQDLLNAVCGLLDPHGQFCVLLPYSRTAALRQLAAAQDLHVVKSLTIRHSADHDIKFEILVLSRQETKTHHEQLVIKSNGQCSPEFSSLLQEFYLKF